MSRLFFHALLFSAGGVCVLGAQESHNSAEVNAVLSGGDPNIVVDAQPVDIDPTNQPGVSTPQVEAGENPSVQVRPLPSAPTPTEGEVVPPGPEQSYAPEEPSVNLNINLPATGEVTLAFPSDVRTSPEAVMTESDTISVDFPNEEVRTIIRNVADLYDLNVVIPDALIGNTSVKLRNVTWRQVFDVVLEPLGYTYVEDRNIIKIRSRAELMQEPLDTRVFVVNYAVAGQLQGALAPLIDAAGGGRIQVDPRTNTLLVTERPSRMNSIQEIIERLDRPNHQVMIESKFIEITDVNSHDVGANWASLQAYNVSVGPFESSISGSFNPFNTAVFSADAFSAVLSLYAKDDHTNLVSNPTVVTLDGEQALISIGQRFPVPNYTYNQERGIFEVSGFAYEDIGINLLVRPQVNSAGFIRLDIRPEVSSILREVNFGGASGAQIPVIASRRTESQVMIKDGYTLAIGGLIESEEGEVDSKVPFFGDIPLVKYLFTSKSNKLNRRNLVIFITARTLNPDGSSYKEILDPRLISDMKILESDIPGYQIPEQELERLNQLARVRQAARDREFINQIEREQQALEMESKRPARTPNINRRSR